MTFCSQSSQVGPSSKQGGFWGLGALALVLVALLACKQNDEQAPTPAAAQPELPANPAEPTPAAAAPEEAPVAAPAAAQPQSRTGIPTEGTSKPPTIAEWNAVGEITVRHSTPLGCETKLIREWLRVSCRTLGNGSNQVLSAALTEGRNAGGIPAFVKKGVASIVMQVRKNGYAVWTFNWSEWGSRKLTVSWPNGNPRPIIEFDRTAG
ncbi:MAG: hypothetical protein H6718_30580 [Polyangiaceae bacterium]|nr:hypothetical protein [Myxococcales bacterium]MCB9589801.1 hypothetical protein [Polyangiaceae bacterium]